MVSGLDLFFSLFNNLAIFIALVTVYGLLGIQFKKGHPYQHQLVLGLSFGVFAMGCMFAKIPVHEGVIVDQRNAIIALCGVFGGPLAAFISAALAGAFRVSLGGDGVFAGIVGLNLAAISGVLLSKFAQPFASLRHATISAACATLVILPGFLFVHDLQTGWLLLQKMAIPYGVAIFLGIFLGGLLLNREEERHQANLLFRASEQKFKTIFNHSHGFIGLLKPDGTLLDVNQTAVEFSGQKKADIINLPFWETAWWQHSDSDKKRLKSAIKQAASGQTVRFEATHIAMDGTLHTFDVSITPIFDDQGQVELLIPEGRDISDRKQMEQHLKESEDRLRELIEQSPIGLALCTMDGSLISINPAYAKIIGYKVEEALKLSYWKITPEKYARQEQIILEQLKASGRYGPYEKEYYHKDGHLVPVRLNGMLVVRDGQRLIWSSVEDITALKAAEAEKNELAEHLRQSQKMEAVGTLAGGVAHDFNNVLAAIFGYTELALRNPNCDAKNRHNLKQVLSAAGRARELIKQILMFSRKQAKSRELVKLDTVIKEAIKLLRKTIPVTISIRQDIDAKTGTVMGDSTQIHQVVMNLCTNAYHALTEETGEISISLKPVTIDMAATVKYPGLQQGAYAQLTITDSGTGMSQETMARMFEPFFTTKRQGEGTGMGLAVIHGIVQSHGGVIGVESSLGKGTSFQVFFPLSSEAPDTQQPTKRYQIQKGTERILLVDDEVMLADLGQETLGDLGYRVTSTTSAKEALELFQASPDDYDLIITDQAMPEMSGDIFAKKALLIRADIAIIICTGYSAVLDAQQAHELGVKAFLLKPVESTELSREIRKIFDQTG